MQRGPRVPRRHGREVHRGRGDGGVRRSPSCTRTTRSAPCGRPPRCATALAELNVELERELVVVAPDPDRREHRRGRRRRPIGGPEPRHRRRGEHGRAAGAGGRRRRDPDRRGDLRARAGRRRRGARRPARPEGQGRGRRRVPAPVGQGRCRGARPPARLPHGRPRATAADAPRRVRERLRRSRVHLFTVFGAAGIGKSRLVREFVSTVGSDARVLSGRCLSYGDGITFWPVSEMAIQAAGIAEDDAPERGARCAPHDARRVRPDGDVVAAHLARLIGLDAGGPGRGPLGRPAVLRVARHGATARRGLRRHPLGRADVPRRDRARRRPIARRPDRPALHGASRAPRRAPGMGRRHAERDERPPGTAVRARGRGADREPARPSGPHPRDPGADPRRRAGEPAVRRGDARDAARRRRARPEGGRVGGRGRPHDGPCSAGHLRAPRRASGPAVERRAGRPRSGVGRRRGVRAVGRARAGARRGCSRTSTRTSARFSGRT